MMDERTPPTNADAESPGIDSGDSGSPDSGSPNSGSPDSGSDTTGIQWIGPYRILRRLGVGGMGEVFLAHDPRLERRVAIKRLLSHAFGAQATVQARLRREARLAAQINHPAVAQIYDLLTLEEIDHIVMEYVPGRSLRDVLADGPLPLGPGLPIVADIAEGLTFAHRHEIIHRDLKTENVLVDEEGQAKIVDFGIARPIETGADGSLASLTHTGAVIGTSRAMSPEQASGHRVDSRSDLFSFGVLIYEVFTGISPFIGRNVLDTLMRLHNHQPEPMHRLVAELPAELCDLVELLLAKSPDQRPASTDHVRSVLRNMATQYGSDLTLAPPRPQDKSQRSGLKSAQPAEDLEPGLGPTVQSPTTSKGRDLRQKLVDSSPATRGRTHQATGEKRWVTILFGDLVHCSKPEADLDPEILFELLPLVRETVQPIIEDFQGHFSETSDLRFQAYFGFPKAHGDDARRAVHCAIEIRQALRQLMLSEELDWDSRIALHTGAGISHYQGTQGLTLTLGNTLDRTMSLRLRAAAGGIVVSASTQRRLGDAFLLTAAGDADAPEDSFTVDGARALHEQTVITEQGPLVGRERDLDLLVDRWHLAREGNGQVVLLSGDAGIGKSRLVLALQSRVEPPPEPWQTTQCSAFSLHSPLAPWRALLLRWLGLDDDRPDHDALIALLQQYELPLAEGVPVLSSFLGWPASDDFPPRLLSAEKQRHETLELLASLLMSRAQAAPLMLVLEDLHLADPSTLEMLSLLVDQSSDAPLLLIMTTRPQFRPQLTPNVPITQLHLDRLRDADVEALLTQLAKQQHLPAALIRQLVNRSDGVPLFAEELIRHLVDSDLLSVLQDVSQQINADHLSVIPGSLHESLVARLDRLDSAKELAQMAAVIGRSFSRRLLVALTQQDVDDLDKQLKRLTEVGILARKGFGAAARYSFRHALLRDAAYDSLLKRQQGQYHADVAAALEEGFPEVSGRQPEVLAHHYEAAGEHETAIGRWLQAGMMTLAEAALDESEGHLQRGLALVPKLSEGSGRDLQELNLLSGLANLFSSRDGFSSAQVESTYRRAQTLVERASDHPQLFQVTWGLWTFRIARSELERAQTLAQRLEELDTLHPEIDHQVEVDYALGFTAFGRGALSEAEKYLLVAAHNEGADSDSPLFFVRVSACNSLATTLWLLGRPDQAVQWSDEGLERARLKSHPVTLLSVLINASLLHLLRGDFSQALQYSKEALEISDDKGFRLFGAQAKGLLGAIYCMDPAQDQGDKGLAMMARSFEETQKAGAVFSLPMNRGLLSASLAHLGRIDEACEVLTETLATYDEDFWTAELHRSLGELQLRSATDDPKSAQKHLDQALAIARRQGAASLELRAAMAQHRYAVDLGLATEVTRQDLLEVYGRFAEGFESADLRAAEQLLEL